MDISEKNLFWSVYMLRMVRWIVFIASNMFTDWDSWIHSNDKGSDYVVCKVWEDLNSFSQNLSTKMASLTYQCKVVNGYGSR